MLTLRDFLPGVKPARPVLRAERAERFCPGLLTPDAAPWQSERCKALVSVSSHLIGSQESGKMLLPPEAELEWWYQYYFATERGRAGYDKYRHAFAKRFEIPVATEQPARS